MKVRYQASSDYIPMPKPIYGAGKVNLPKPDSALKLQPNYHSGLMNQTYAIRFEVKYPTKFGESIGVIGSTEELGKWKKVKVHLKWTQDNLWVSKEAFITQ